MQYPIYAPDDCDLVNIPILVRGGKSALIVLWVLMKFESHYNNEQVVITNSTYGYDKRGSLTDLVTSRL